MQLRDRMLFRMKTRQTNSIQLQKFCLYRNAQKMVMIGCCFFLQCFLVNINAQNDGNSLFTLRYINLSVQF